MIPGATVLIQCISLPSALSTISRLPDPAIFNSAVATESAEWRRIRLLLWRGSTDFIRLRSSVSVEDG